LVQGKKLEVKRTNSVLILPFFLQTLLFRLLGLIVFDDIGSLLIATETLFHVPNGVADKAYTSVGDVILIKTLNEAQAAFSIELIHIMATAATFSNSPTGHKAKIVEDKLTTDLVFLYLIL
jgi:hypothetical protein